MAPRSAKSAATARSTEFVGGSPPPRDPDERSFLIETVRKEARLVVTNGPHRYAEYTLRGRENLIGRGDGVDVQIDEPSASRRHALILRKEDGFYLKDLGTTNGTYLGGLLRGREHKLCEGDQFRIGRTEFLFHDETREGEKRRQSP